MTKQEVRLLEDELDGEHGVSEERRAAAKEASGVATPVGGLLESEGYVPSQREEKVVVNVATFTPGVEVGEDLLEIGADGR